MIAETPTPMKNLWTEGGADENMREPKWEKMFSRSLKVPVSLLRASENGL